jgi:segregation and condensation protein B
VTKSEVEAIRGVDASGVLATLLERNLCTIKGRSTVVGRPLLYGTTNEFLNYFGLGDLSELPRPEELRALVAAREPEQLEMMELDPESGMPLQLAQGEAPAPQPDLVAALVAAAPDAAPVREDIDAFSIADADAAIARANAARAEAAMAFVEPPPPAEGAEPVAIPEDLDVDADLEALTAEAGAGDYAEASADDEADEDEESDEDEDEFDEDDDDEFDDAYDDEDEDDEDGEAEDEEDSEHPSAVLDEHGSH